MRLLELHIDGFGKFHDRTISFNDGQAKFCRYSVSRSVMTRYNVCMTGSNS